MRVVFFDVEILMLSTDLSARVFSYCACDFTMPVEACACVGMHKAIPINIVAMMSFFVMLNPP